MALLSLGMLIDHNFKRPSSLNRKNWFGEELFSSLVLLLKKKKFWNDMNYTGWPVFRSNQQAQADLQQLRQDINDFVQSVLANPENKGKALSVRWEFFSWLRIFDKISVWPIFSHYYDFRETFAADPLNLERVQLSAPPAKVRTTVSVPVNDAARPA